MAEGLTLRGISWDHPRGLQPLRETLDAYAAIEPDVRISWAARSLLGFGEEPLEKLAEDFDLLVIDHPFVGYGAATGCILPLDTLLPRKDLKALAEASVGPSFQSYQAEGHLWALPIDAAAQVAVYRPDLLSGQTLPARWDDVFDLARTLRGKGQAIGLPMTHTDLVPTFLTLAANVGSAALRPPFDYVMDPAQLNVVLDLLLRLRDVAEPATLDLDPPGLLDRMSSDDVIAYCPLTFGYSNYSRRDFRRFRLRFADMPSVGLEPAGSTLGGAGIALSARNAAPRRAAHYAAWLADGATQRTAYFGAGGQPAHRSAWLDGQVNELADGFFMRTLRTLDRAYLRPRYAGYLLFQDLAGPALRSFVLNQVSRLELDHQLHHALEASIAARTRLESGMADR